MTDEQVFADELLSYFETIRLESGIGLNGRFADTVGYAPVGVYPIGEASNLPASLRDAMGFKIPDDADLVIIKPIGEEHVAILAMRKIDSDGLPMYAHAAAYPVGFPAKPWAARLQRRELLPEEIATFFKIIDGPSRIEA